jgi:hypothetical protein
MINYVTAESFNRDKLKYPDPNNYTLFLANPIHEVKRVDLVNARVPNATKNLSSGTNVLSVSTLSGSTITFSLKAGFYSAETLAAEINAQIYNLTRVQIRYLDGEGKFLFYRTNGTTTPFTIGMKTEEIAELMGFPLGDSTSGILTASVNLAAASSVVPINTFHEYYGTTSGSTFSSYQILKSTNLVNTNKYAYIYLDIDELRNPLVSSGIPSSTPGNISQTQFTFSPIMLEEGSLGMKYFYENSDFGSSITFEAPLKKLSQLTISWKKSDGTLMDFEGLDSNAFQLRIHS